MVVESFDASHSRRLQVIFKDQEEPVSLRPSWAASVSIFYEPQPNHHVGIIKHQLGYTTTENVSQRQLIGGKGAAGLLRDQRRHGQTLQGIQFCY